MSGHTHPCANCATPVECDGELVKNYNGWPEVVCTAYHEEHRAGICESCLREDDLRHDADAERDDSQE